MQGGAEGYSQGMGFDKLLQRSTKCFGVVRVYEKPGFAVFYDLGDTANARSNDGEPCKPRFQDDIAECFGERGEDKNIEGGEKTSRVFNESR